MGIFRRLFGSDSGSHDIQRITPLSAVSLKSADTSPQAPPLRPSHSASPTPAPDPRLLPLQKGIETNLGLLRFLYSCGSFDQTQCDAYVALSKELGKPLDSKMIELFGMAGLSVGGYEALRTDTLIPIHTQGFQTLHKTLSQFPHDSTVTKLLETSHKEFLSLRSPQAKQVRCIGIISSSPMQDVESLLRYVVNEQKQKGVDISSDVKLGQKVGNPKDIGNVAALLEQFGYAAAEIETLVLGNAIAASHFTMESVEGEYFVVIQ